MPSDLFRQEALEFWTRQRGPGSVLRVAPAWVRWLYWIVLALMIAGLALAFSARFDESISGPALINTQERVFAAVLPESVNSGLPSGRPLRLEVDGLSGRRRIAARALHVQVAAEADVERAGFHSFPQPAMLVTGVLNADAADLTVLPAAPRLPGRAVVVLRSERVLSVLLRGLEATWKGGDS